MEKIESLTSEDIVQKNVEKLKELFPAAFSEGRLITEELLAILGAYTEKEVEYYHMDWAGKTRARMEANKVSTGTLRPAPEESKHWDDTGNLFIEGDNLEVLKLLQKSYSNKVKMIYIDPPYNTGKDFVYKDNYHDNLKNYLELSGQADEKGRKLSANTESDGRYHSNWLNMMYPRLMLARNLLTEDGVIFISIDDNEQANLKKLCDEIFGEENFVIDLIRKTKSMTGDESVGVNIQHENLITYAKKKKSLILKGEKKNLFNYKNPDNDPLGDWTSGDPSAKSGGESTYFAIKNPFTSHSDFPPKGRYWAFSKETLARYISMGRVKFRKKVKEGSRGFIFKRYKNELNNLYNPVNSLAFTDNDFMNQVGTKELQNLLEGTYFDNPKPVRLLKNILKYSSNSNEIIIDFFAGSGTTAHAVMALNAEDGGNRKCISIQLPEPTEEKSEAYKAGYSTIAEIAKERIRRVGELIRKEEEHKIIEKKDKLENLIGTSLIRETYHSDSDSVNFNLKLTERGGGIWKFPDDCIVDETAENLLEELNEAEGRIRNLDTGFRVFTLDSSNLHTWDPDTERFETQLDELFARGADPIKTDRTESDILYEILLKFGLELTVPILEKTFHDQIVYNIGFGTLYICLGENIHVEIAKGIGEWHKEFADEEPTVIFRDSGFPDDAAKTNTVQMLNQYGIENVNSI